MRLKLRFSSIVVSGNSEVTSPVVCQVKCDFIDQQNWYNNLDADLQNQINSFLISNIVKGALSAEAKAFFDVVYQVLLNNSRPSMLVTSKLKNIFLIENQF